MFLRSPIILTLLLLVACKLRGPSGSDVEMARGKLATGKEIFMPKVVALTMPVSEEMARGCSGVLVGPKHVVTAAHCVHSAKKIIVDRYERNLSSSTRNGVAWKAFPDFKNNQSGISHVMSAIDLGIVVVDAPFPPPFMKLNPNRANSIPNAIYIGVGKSEGNKSDEKLRYAENIHTTRIDYRGWGSIWQSRGVAALCPGDSGGPLITSAGELLGINSTISAAASGKHGICGESKSSTQADVYAHLDWIVCTFKGWGAPLPGFEKFTCNSDK